MLSDIRSLLIDRDMESFIGKTTSVIASILFFFVVFFGYAAITLILNNLGEPLTNILAMFQVFLIYFIIPGFIALTIICICQFIIGRLLGGKTQFANFYSKTLYLITLPSAAFFLILVIIHAIIGQGHVLAVDASPYYRLGISISNFLTILQIIYLLYLNALFVKHSMQLTNIKTIITSVIPAIVGSAIFWVYFILLTRVIP
mgnify:CR=1 FL=1